MRHTWKSQCYVVIAHNYSCMENYQTNDFMQIIYKAMALLENIQQEAQKMQIL